MTKTYSRLFSVNGSPREPAVERLDLESGDVDEAEPLVLRGPPQTADATVVVHDVEAVVADCVMDSVGERCLLRSAVSVGGEVVVEHERVPREPSAWLE